MTTRYKGKAVPNRKPVLLSHSKIATIHQLSGSAVIHSFVLSKEGTGNPVSISLDSWEAENLVNMILDGLEYERAFSMNFVNKRIMALSYTTTAIFDTDKSELTLVGMDDEGASRAMLLDSSEVRKLLYAMVEVLEDLEEKREERNHENANKTV